LVLFGNSDKDATMRRTSTKELEVIDAELNLAHVSFNKALDHLENLDPEQASQILLAHLEKSYQILQNRLTRLGAKVIAPSLFVQTDHISHLPILVLLFDMLLAIGAIL
jgi:hypothetical protein